MEKVKRAVFIPLIAAIVTGAVLVSNYLFDKESVWFPIGTFVFLTLGILALVKLFNRQEKLSS